MTTDEFKKLKPEYAELEGEQLWNAMEDHCLRQSAGQEVMKTAMPFFKRYQLRWIFYRKPLMGFVFQKSNYASDERCASCKKGVSQSFGLMYGGKIHMWCPKCGKELVKEKNTNLNHRIWLIYRKLYSVIYISLDWLHITRKSGHDRYGMFGDESKYIHSWTFNIETGKSKVKYKPRKWWEYIFIERNQFKF